MIALIPIFLRDDNPFWRSDDAREILAKPLVASLKARKIHRTIVCSNDRAVLDSIKHLDLDTCLLEISEELTSSPVLPAGSISALQYVLEALELKFTDVLILSYKNPLITSDFIDQAVNQYRSSKSSLAISARKPADHPCQLSSYYKIIDTGFIHLFESDEEMSATWRIKLRTILDEQIPDAIRASFDDKGRLFDNTPYRATRPFYFDWASKQIGKKSHHGIYFRTCQNRSVHYQAFEHIATTPVADVPVAFWLYENDNSARVLMGSNILKNPQQLCEHSPPMQLIGTTLTATDDQPSMELYSAQDSALLYLKCYAAHSPYATHILKSVVIGHSTIQTEVEETEIQIDDLSRPIRVQYQTNNSSGILYSLLQYPVDDSYDISEEFPAPDKLWTRNAANQKINTKTGEAIMGRQDFPEIFEVEGSLFIFKKEVMSFLLHELSRGKAHFILMQDNSSIQIDSRLDLLKYRALSRAACNAN